MQNNRVRGLHHAGIVVPDLELAITFYCQALAMHEMHRGQWDHPNPMIDAIIGVPGTSAEFALLKADFGYLELFEYRLPEQAAPKPMDAYHMGIRHICFEVDDPDAVLKDIVLAGGIEMNKPQQFAGGGKAVYCRDPFGNLLELTTATGRMPSLASQGTYIA